MILASDNITNKENKKHSYRLLLLGRKKLPEVIEGKSHPSERNWAFNILTTTDPKDLEELLTPAEYSTKTKGTKRLMPTAIPTGEGKYSVVKHGNYTELAYVLEIPKKLGPSQSEFEIKKEASYIISVKNPEINIPGFASFSNKKPNYPNNLKELFGNRRWLSVQNAGLLDYENTQLLLIGARKKDVEEELEIEINEVENEKSAELLMKLHVDKNKIPIIPLFKGKFPTEKEIPPLETEEIKHLSKVETPGQGEKKGGKVAATSAPSAAAIAKILGGIDLPKKKDGLVEHAENNKSKVENAEEIINTIKDLPSNISFTTMAEVEKALSEIR